MGFVKRYWQEAEENKIPNWHKCVIVELSTGEARVQVRGYVNISEAFMPECPKTFATYEEAFAWLERKLTKYAPDRFQRMPASVIPLQTSMFADVPPATTSGR